MAQTPSIEETLRYWAEQEEKKKQEKLAQDNAAAQALISQASTPVSGGVEVNSLDRAMAEKYRAMIDANVTRRDQDIQKLREMLDKSPGQQAKEWKAKDREGKSKIGNFFRNLDYDLSSFDKRDFNAANERQKAAQLLLDNLYKDQGTELERSVTNQNKLFGQLKALDQKGAAIGLGGVNAAANRNVGATNSGIQNVIKATQADSQIGLNDKRGEMIDSQIGMNDWRKQFAPYGVGGSKEIQDIQYIMRLRQAGKNEEADEVEKQLKEKKAMNYMMQMATKGGMDTNRGQLLQGVDKDGNITYKEVRVDNKVNNPWRDKIESMLSPQGKASSTVRYDEAPITETLTNAAKAAATPQKAIKTVNKALGNTASESQKQYLAATSLQDGLTAKEIEFNASRRNLGHRFTVWPARNQGSGIVNTGMKKNAPSITPKLGDFAEYDLKMVTPAKAIMKGAANGMLEKAFGASNNPFTTVRNMIGGTMPEGFRKATTSEIAEDPTRVIDNTFPNLINSKDPQVNSFITSLKELVSSSETAIQLKNTGKAATEFEIQRLANRLPKPSDTPQVALEKMIAFTLTERVGGYLASRGYNKEQIQRAHNYMSDFISPRIQDIVKQIGNAKSAYANKLVAKPEDAIKNLDLNSIDPEDLFGDALYQYVKKQGGKASLKDIENTTGIRVSRLVPDEESQGGGFTAPRQLIDSLKNPYGLKRRGAAK